MKKLLALFLLILLTMPAMAQTKTHNFEIAYELSNYQYKEPGIMSLKAQHKQGLSATYMYAGYKESGTGGYFFEADLRYLQGDVDYKGATWGGDPLTADNLKDYYFEGALKVGRGYVLGEKTDFILYTGLGYRQLRNHLEESGEGGYLRQSIYLYLPIGAHLVYNVPEQWSARLTGEFDILLHGKQKSDLAEDSSGITNDQHSGIGLRLSLKIEKTIGKIGLFVEPFWRYWKIEESDDVQLYIPGEGMGSVVEPKNNTREYGIKAGISF